MADKRKVASAAAFANASEDCFRTFTRFDLSRAQVQEHMPSNGIQAASVHQTAVIEVCQYSPAVLTCSL